MYKVELEDEGCQHCGKGKKWIVVDPEGVGGPTTYEDEEHAQEMCDELNEAYDLGRKKIA